MTIFVKKRITTFLAILFAMAATLLFVYSLWDVVRSEKLLKLELEYVDNLKRIIANDSRFNAVKIGASTALAISLNGRVGTESDLLTLKSIVLSNYPPVRVLWYVSVDSSEPTNVAPPQIIWNIDPRGNL